MEWFLSLWKCQRYEWHKETLEFCRQFHEEFWWERGGWECWNNDSEDLGSQDFRRKRELCPELGTVTHVPLQQRVCSPLSMFWKHEWSWMERQWDNLFGEGNFKIVWPSDCDAATAHCVYLAYRGREQTDENKIERKCSVVRRGAWTVKGAGRIDKDGVIVKELSITREASDFAQGQ